MKNLLYSLRRGPVRDSDRAKVYMETGLHKTLAAFSLILAVVILLTWIAQPVSRQIPTHEKIPVVSGSTFPLSIRGTAGAALTTGTFAPLMAPELRIAIADFTGDTHPDLAAVELEGLDSSSAHYWIEIRLTEGGHQILSLTAPFGGLAITPRDVTGDGNLDLVVRSAESNAPVAVFLNDGSGHFSRAANIRAFATALNDDSSQFGFTTQQTYFVTTLACLESYAAERPTGLAHHLREQKGSLLPGNYRAAFQPLLSFGANRAPPSLT